MRETVIRLGAAPPMVENAHAPPPRQAPQRIRRAGAEITAAWSSPVALHGQERPEDRNAAHVVVGAVDGVDVPARRRLVLRRLLAELLADDAVLGEPGADLVAQPLLDRGVGLGHERPVRLPLGRGLAEMAHRDRVRLDAPGERRIHPAAQLRLGSSPQRGAPGGAERNLGHALAPIAYGSSR